MCNYFYNSGFPKNNIDHSRAHVSTAERTDALTSAHSIARIERIPLVCTYHPINKTLMDIILKNIKILQDDPETAPLFKEPPIISYKLDKNIKD